MAANVAKDRIATWVKQQIKEYQTVPRKTLTLGNLLFVAGHSGVGKSYTVNKICEELDLHSVSITTTNCSCSNELSDLLVKNCTSSLIQVLCNDTRAKIIVIDEFESLMSLDRTVNITLLNILTSGKLKMVPIICIASSEIVRKIGNIKKKCQIIEIDDPTPDDIYIILQDVYPIQAQRDATGLKHIASIANGNIAQAIEMARGSTMSSSVDEQVTINYLYGNHFDREKVRKIITADPWMAPLKYHENLISELGRRKIAAAKAKDLYTKFITDVLIFDKLMHNDAPLIAADIFASIVHPLTTAPLKKNIACNMDNFTKILSYLSLQKKYMKKIYTNTDYPLYQIGSYHTNIMNRRNYIFLN
jgi:nucleoside-triphosphatase THEP1